MRLALEVLFVISDTAGASRTILPQSFLDRDESILYSVCYNYI